MKDGPLLGLVIPSFNDEVALQQTLERLASLPSSVLEQLELAVMDGGSSDGTMTMSTSFIPIVDHWDSRRDEGIYDAMNRGVQRLRSPWVWFLGSGDFPVASSLARLLDILRDSPRDTLAHAFAVAALPPLEPGVPERFIPRWGAPLTWRNSIHHQGLVAPTSWLLKTPFDSSIQVLGDYAWLLDQRHLGMHVECHPEQVIAEVASAGRSRNFNLALYAEEWRVKRRRLTFFPRMAHLVWLPLKWAFKQMSKARRIFGSSTPQ